MDVDVDPCERVVDSISCPQPATHEIVMYDVGKGHSFHMSCGDHVSWFIDGRPKEDYDVFSLEA